MGAWGTNIQDNDKALDFTDNILQYMIKKGKENEEILMIGKLLIDNNEIFTLTDNSIYDIIYNVINNELNNLNNWNKDCQEDRKNNLIQLKKKLKKQQNNIIDCIEHNEENIKKETIKYDCENSTFKYLLPNTKCLLNKHKIFKQNQFVLNYEKTHLYDLCKIFKEFEAIIDYNINSIEIKMNDYPQMFKSKKMENEFYDYLELKGFKYTKSYPRVGKKYEFFIEISL